MLNDERRHFLSMQSQWVRDCEEKASECAALRTRAEAEQQQNEVLSLSFVPRVHGGDLYLPKNANILLHILHVALVFAFPFSLPLASPARFTNLPSLRVLLADRFVCPFDQKSLITQFGLSCPRICSC